MKHREKQRLARRMRTLDEVRRRVPIFQTEFWSKRSFAREKKLLSKCKNV